MCIIKIYTIHWGEFIISFDMHTQSSTSQTTHNHTTDCKIMASEINRGKKNMSVHWSKAGLSITVRLSISEWGIQRSLLREHATPHWTRLYCTAGECNQAPVEPFISDLLSIFTSLCLCLLTQVFYLLFVFLQCIFDCVPDAEMLLQFSREKRSYEVMEIIPQYQLGSTEA